MKNKKEPIMKGKKKVTKIEEPIKVEKEKQLLASEHARENGKNPLDFKWWDTKEGLMTKVRYEEIEKTIYGGK